LAFGFVDENGEEIDSSESGSNSESGRPFFISEYKDMSPLTERSAAILGRRLAMEMHGYASRPSSGTESESESDGHGPTSGLGFGFGVPTFCGATRLRNGWYETWEQCFDVLIGDLLSTLEARGGYSELCRKGQDVRLR
jgi:fructosamine-3-kinase